MILSKIAIISPKKIKYTIETIMRAIEMNF